jgi:hypothetical protein
MLASKRFPPPFPQRPVVVPLPHPNVISEEGGDVGDKCDVRRLLEKLEKFCN